MGRRWGELRDRVVGLVQQAWRASLGAGELYVDLGADLLHVVRVGRGRAEVERHGEAAQQSEVTWPGSGARCPGELAERPHLCPSLTWRGLLHELMTAAGAARLP